MMPTHTHLTAQQIGSLSRGTVALQEHEEHLATCESCRNALERVRRVGYFLAPKRSQRGKPPKDHVAADVLSALFNNALSPMRVEAVTKHLQACDKCLARYEKIRRGELATPLPTEVTAIAPIDLPRLQRKLRSMLPSMRGGKSKG